jgi:flagellar motility protein MotE (MotC chaperone)
MATDNEEKFAGMTRAEVLEAARALNQEFDENEEDSNTYSEYIKTMEAGQKELSKQEGYYQYFSQKNNN